MIDRANNEFPEISLMIFFLAKSSNSFFYDVLLFSVLINNLKTYISYILFFNPDNFNARVKVSFSAADFKNYSQEDFIVY